MRHLIVPSSSLTGHTDDLCFSRWLTITLRSLLFVLDFPNLSHFDPNLVSCHIVAQCDEEYDGNH